VRHGHHRHRDRAATREGFRVEGSGFRVQGTGLRVQGSGFRVQGAGFRVQGAGFEEAGVRHGHHRHRDRAGCGYIV
jgi:hypothetical protein